MSCKANAIPDVDHHPSIQSTSSIFQHIIGGIWTALIDCFHLFSHLLRELAGDAFLLPIVHWFGSTHKVFYSDENMGRHSQYAATKKNGKDDLAVAFLGGICFVAGFSVMLPSALFFLGNGKREHLECDASF